MNDPHGGTLINRTPQGEELHDLLLFARALPRIQISNRELNDLQLIGNGALSPLVGFMHRADYECVLSQMRLSGGLVWTIPVTLSVRGEDAPRVGHSVGLYDEAGALRAVMEVSDVYRYDKREEARSVYGTIDERHPGVAALYARHDVLIGGPVNVFPAPLDPLSLSPLQTRSEFAARSWRTIVAFQTRNPVHRAHEYIQKCALEMVDGLLLHPLVGETKADDIPADVRIRCYRALLEQYYPADRVVLSTLPAAMRYAGPREAIFHALMRKNFGCTHFIVGRDHAGVGNYYGPYDAQALFNSFSPHEIGIEPLKFENAFYCTRCQAMASLKTCSHDPAHHVSLSGTAVRAMLSEGRLPPPEFSRPEVARILIEATASSTI